MIQFKVKNTKNTHRNFTLEKYYKLKVNCKNKNDLKKHFSSKKMSSQKQQLIEQIHLASVSKLEDIVDECKKALNKQYKLREIEIQKNWIETYQKWFDEYPLDGKLSITRHQYDGMLYYQIDGEYKMFIKTNYMEITDNNDVDDSDCRFCLFFDGTHEGCVRDSCNKFDVLIMNQEMIKYLTIFKTEVHDVMLEAAERLKLILLE